MAAAQINRIGEALGEPQRLAWGMEINLSHPDKLAMKRVGRTKKMGRGQ